MRTFAVFVLCVALLVGCSGVEVETSQTSVSVEDASASTTTTVTAVATTNPAAAATTTVPVTSTTAPAPVPPFFEVTDPISGRTVATRAYSFTGVVDSGCVVDVGDRYFADVRADGNWTLDLMLRPGDNSTTITATDPISGLVTSETLRVRYEPEVDLDHYGGIGEIGCATPYEESMAALVELFGPADRLDVADDGASPGAEGEAEWQWAKGGLMVRFASWSLCIMGQDDEYLHLIGWELHGDSAGLSVGGAAPGATVADLMSVVDAGDRCEEARSTGQQVDQGCILLDTVPRDDGTYWFFRSEGLMPPSIFGYATTPDPATSIIITLTSQAPT